MKSSLPIRLLLILQAIAAIRVILRMARSARGERIATTVPGPATASGTVSVIVPVLDEVHRLGPCLDGLSAQPPVVGEILVVDGGSTDGTQALVERFIAQDSRIRLVDASPVPGGWNGKAWGLQVGWEHRDAAAAWVLTLDADVRPKPPLVSSLMNHAEVTDLEAFSVATPQRLSGAAEAIVHPALLATLVYRYGIPGSATTSVEDVQANGQCFLARVDVLQRIGGFWNGQGAISEDVTIARSLVAHGLAVGFFEPAGGVELVDVEMYDGWRDAWRNWTRSLPMRDHSSGYRWWLKMFEMTLTMGLPLVILLVGAGRFRAGSGDYHHLTRLNLGLVAMRYGVAAGMRRAYRDSPPTYWLSPLVDPAVCVKLWNSALRRHHEWRGRPIVRATLHSVPPTSGEAPQA
ncbi:MAG: glycosyltransferase [Chloroflexota bacterium]|nr:glycosyltransferase [Chloroflexia bacterium]MDQ3442049.1 glycosyltransferase [Chloroflexota bacterium]